MKEHLEIRNYQNAEGKNIWGIFYIDKNGGSVLSKSPYKKVIEKRLGDFQYRLERDMLLDCDKSEEKW